mgnify:CR=1 FL=1
MNQIWNKINNDNDIQYVLARFGYFYDACIKEAKYISGSYVDKDSSMHPMDDLNQLHIIIQTQHKEHSVIELVFEGVERFNLVPVNENFDSLIGGLRLMHMNGFFYFSNNKEIEISELDKHSDFLTWLKAKSVKWKEVNQYIGDSIVYIHRD